MNNQWVKSSNDFYIREVSQNIPKLEKGVYKLNQNPNTSELFLTLVSDNFQLPTKVYGIETRFINRVKKTYENTKNNLGILMNGVKGTGKTVTGKQISNLLELPTIIIHKGYNNIPSFINDIQQNVVIFIDEYEKVFSEKDRKDEEILTIMDGALDNGFRKVFIFTTNNLYINSNLLQRPGRIRYLKTYKDLNLEVINEIVGDRLIHPELKDVTVDFISTLETITVDIVNAVIDEVNIHQENPLEFKEVFNIKTLDDKVNIYIHKPNQPMELYRGDAKMTPRKVTFESVGGDFYVNDNYLGDILTVLSEDTFIVEQTDKDDNIFHVQYTVEPVKQKHYSFIY